MALIQCPECGGKVSDKATACIHCGYPLNENFNNYHDDYPPQMTSYEQWVEDIKAYNPWTWPDIIAKGYPGK